MASQLLNKLSISVLFISLLTILYNDRVTCFEYKVSPFEKCFKTTLQNSVSIVLNKTAKISGLVDDKVTFPGLHSTNVSTTSNLQRFNQHTGYYDIKDSHGARMFYFFFESRRRKSDPVVLWLIGGPGAGSLPEVFIGNGPFRINEDLSLKWNDFGWDKVSNMLYVDQPIGAGYSYSSDNRDFRSSTTDVVNDLYNLLQAFYEAHPGFKKNDFYIAGVSYAGHTVPQLASRIHKENLAKRGTHINLKGFAVGNGYTNPEYQASAYYDYALEKRLISRKHYKYLKTLNEQCLWLIRECQTRDDVCEQALFACEWVLGYLVNLAGNIDIYDIRGGTHPQTCEVASRMMNYLKLDSVKRALKVGDMEYVIINYEVVLKMARSDSRKNYAGVIPQLLEDGIKVLIYAGEYDLICNWIGNLRWMSAMKWSGQSQFLETKLTSYKIDGKRVGQMKRTGPLTFIKVHDASHSVTTDQPKVALQMINEWING